MGIFNWAMKGFNVKREPVDRTAVTLEQPETVAQQPVHQPQYESRILFDDQIAPTPQMYAQAPSYQPGTNFAGAFAGHAVGNRSILVVTPRTSAETMGIVEHLKTGEACIVCLEGLAIGDSQRRIDFLSGAVYTLGGTVKALDANKYILTPSGVGVRH